MPPEWYPHHSTWLAWPKDPATWPDRVPQVQEIYLRLISLLAARETVDPLVDDEPTQETIRHQLLDRNVPLEQVRFHLIPTVDSWIRDYGPNFLLRPIRGKELLAFNHWIFNAWGEKYEELKQDARIPARLESVLEVPRFTPPLVLEGGGIDVNGEGVCLTTESCLLNPNRNPDCSRPEVEQYLKDFLGVDQVIWLGEGIAGGDTDGHVDELARFVNPNTIVCTLEEDPADENYASLRDNYQRLQKARDPKGHPFEVVSLPMPKAVRTPLRRLPASYANFYIANGVVLVPTFGQPQDRTAVEILQRFFCDREVIGVHCLDMLWGLGTLHCVTQQQPATT